MCAALDSFLSILNIWRLKQVKLHLCLKNCVTCQNFLGLSFSALVNDPKQTVTSPGSSDRACSLVLQLGSFSQLPLEFDQGSALEANEGAWNYTLCD